jgi:hypothetical protein
VRCITALHYCCCHHINPLNAELNPICHLLALLGNLTFMGPCIVSIFQYTCISNNMQRYTVYLHLESALHVSGGTSTHHQERIQLYVQHLVFVTPLQLSAAIVEELEPVGVCCGWRTPPTAHSNQFQLYFQIFTSGQIFCWPCSRKISILPSSVPSGLRHVGM